MVTKTHDPDRLRRVYESTTHFTHADCGCILRGDGQQIRYCRRDNIRRGTHGVASNGY
jgi:hypothetical protein